MSHIQGTDKTKQNNTLLILSNQTKQNSIGDRQNDIKLDRSEQTGFLPKIGEQNGNGKKYIYCPHTNIKYNVKSKKGNFITESYNNHFHNKKLCNGCPFQKILNEKTGRKVSIYGKIGKNILNQYSYLG
jgi:hypothetical protein